MKSFLKKNTAAVKGGAVVIEKDTVIKNSTFDSNSQTSTATDTAGGAVFIDGAKVKISDSTSFTKNTGFLGGAVNVRNGSTLSITDATFSGNTANGFGGAISDYEDKKGAVQNELISISRTVFKNNHDSKGGGALHVVNTKAIDITGSEFSSNFSAGKGGAIQLENGAKLAVTDTVFNGNSTNYWGGAIRVLGADATISVTKDISMTGNKANVNGQMSAYYSDMGGFAYLQGNSKLTLAGENGATLTIGDANTVDKTIDSIASSGGYESSANELILKGNVVINSSLEAFSDKITVADNANVTMATGFASNRISLQADINGYGDVAYDDYGTSELSLGEKASLTMGDLVINRAGSTGVKEYGNPGVKITAGQNSTLNLKSLSLVTKKYLSKGKETNVTTTGYGLFNLTDATVNVAGDVTLADNTRLTVTGPGNFNVKGNVNTNGELTFNATDIDIAGKLTVAKTGIVTLEGQNLELSARDLTNTGKIAAGDGLLKVTGTLDNAAGVITVQNLAVANGADENIEGLKNLTILDAGAGKGFTTATDRTLESLKVENGGNFTGKALILGQLINDGKIAAERVTVAEVMTNAGTLTANTLNVKNGSSKAGELKANVLDVAGTFELGDKATVGEASVAEDASLTATTLGLNKLAIGQNGQMTAAALTVTDLVNDGTVTANTLSVKNGSSKAGELKANTLNVSGTFELGDKATVGDASVNEGASLTATTLGLNKLAVAQKGQMTATGALTADELANVGSVDADTVTVNKTFTNNGTLKAKTLTVKDGTTKDGALETEVLNVAGAFELGNNIVRSQANVGTGAKLTAQTLDLASLTVAKEGQLTTADELTAAKLDNAGTVTAKTINVKDGSSKNGSLTADVLNVAGAFELGTNELKQVNLNGGASLAAQTLDLASLTVAKEGKLTAAEALKAADIDNAGSITVKSLDAAQFKGEGTLTAENVVFGEKNDLSGFKGAATLNGGTYALTDKNAVRWFGGKTTLTGASVDVRELTNAEGTLANMTVAGGSLTAVSGQIFKTKLADTYVADPEAVVTKAGLKSGTLTFVDAKYSVDYANKADALIKDMTLVFTGSLVSAPAPEVPPTVESKEDLKAGTLDNLDADNKVIFNAALDNTEE